MKKRCAFIIVLFTITLPLAPGCSSEEKNAQALYKEGIALRKKGKPREAFDVFKEVINKFPSTETTANIYDMWKKEISMSLKLFELDNGTYPTTEDGLTALVQNVNPSRYKNWKGRGYMQHPQTAIEIFKYFSYRKTGDNDFQLALK